MAARRRRGRAGGRRGGSNAPKRIKKEVEELQADFPDYLNGFDCVEDNVYHWEASINGPEGSPYEGGQFTLKFEYPPEYPMKPPKVTMTTPIYHMAVSESGGVCLAMLKDGQWSPVTNLVKLLAALNDILTDPDPSHPLNTEAAAEFVNNRQEHDRKAREMTQAHAM